MPNFLILHMNMPDFDFGKSGIEVKDVAELKVEIFSQREFAS